MKPKKKKFNIKSFFVQHVEKILLVSIIPAAGFIAYQGTTFKLLPWQPDDLKSLADRAETHVKTSEHMAVDEGIELTRYNERATWIKYGVQEELYLTPTPWMPSLFPEKYPRGIVELYAVSELKAASGLGAVSVGAPLEVLQVIRPDLYEKATTPTTGTATTTGGGGSTGSGTTGLRTGERWAVITGLIPVQRQLEAYVSAYSNSVAPDPLRDTPYYFTYDVERAEVVPGRGLSNLRWEKIDVEDQTRRKQELWGSSLGMDPVDPTYMAPITGVPGSLPMSYFLPPVNRKFGEEVAHSPDVPLLTDSQTELLRQTEELQQRMINRYFQGGLQRTTGPIDPFGRSTSGGGNAGGGLVRGQMLGRGQMPGAELEDEDTLDPIVVTHYLYRFLDFSVQPGKTYRYRVRLGLANPNFGLLPTQVLEENLTTEPVLYSEYCDPSNLVTIPMDSRILATNVTATADKIAEPVASVLAVYFDMLNGSEWYVAQERVLRGATINFKNREVVNPELENRTATRTTGTTATPPPRRRPRGAAVEEDPSKRNVDLISDVCVLDMQGGRLLNKVDRKAPDLRSPSKLLVLEPSGNMVIRSVNADLAEADQVQNPMSASSRYGQGGASGGYGSDYQGGGGY